MIDAIRAQMRAGHRSILLQAPTGSGKTVMFSFMIKGAVERGLSCWVIQHRKELIDQTRKTLDTAGVASGIICAGSTASSGNAVQVASIQTLARRTTSLTPPDLIVWDECHHVAATGWARVKEWAKASYHIGSTATPMRLDGTGMGEYFSSLTLGPTVRWLIDNNYLSDYDLYAPSAPDTAGIRRSMGDFHKGDLERIMSTSSLTGNVIEHYNRLCPGASAVAFCVNVTHSKRVAEAFNKEGISASHVDGKTRSNERSRILKEFASGRIAVLCNCDLFGEGLDIPSIRAAILLRPTQSLGLYLQQVGRPLRVDKGKDRAIILDHAGNAARPGFGLPCDDREWTLEGKRRGANDRSGAVPGARICPGCFGASPGGVSVCLLCGLQFPLTERQIQEKEGELVKFEKQQDRIKQGRCETMDELIAEGVRRGMDNPRGWAWFISEARRKKRHGKRIRKPKSLVKPRKNL